LLRQEVTLWQQSAKATSNVSYSIVDLNMGRGNVPGSTKLPFKSPATLKSATMPRSAKALSPSNGYSD
jgi:hypothetical protein